MTKRSLALAISQALRWFDAVNGWIRRRLGQPSPRRGVVLYYHAIKAHQRGRFSRQMDEVLKCARPFPAGRPEAMAQGCQNVAVTFDDGFRSVVENALPELVKRRIPFTLFVPSGCLGERPSWVHDPEHPSFQENVLSAGELRALVAESLAAIGSHSISHPNLLYVAPDRAWGELIGCKAGLEAAMGTKVDLFSFPHGGYTAALVEQARQAGYRLVFTIEPTMATPEPDVFTIGRVAVDPDDWMPEFRLKLAGAYRWRSCLHRRRQAL